VIGIDFQGFHVTSLGSLELFDILFFVRNRMVTNLHPIIRISILGIKSQSLFIVLNSFRLLSISEAHVANSIVLASDRLFDSKQKLMGSHISPFRKGMCSFIPFAKARYEYDK